MSIRYRINIIAALKEHGYNTNRIRREKILSESTLQAFRIGQPVSWMNIDRVCALLNCQPGDLLEYVDDESDSNSPEDDS